ncbi:MAG TPA: 16S rRNA (guanine(966)-N(2))-methyltransferase RsmD [Arenimonas sp.]|nr:16S rRNA (guanine(966)-N(2))-methyltransferase RsmD [Arenimonas sp.]
MNARRPSGEVRIIGGRLRGSKLPVADSPGLRPTSDRVRETLFNWLQPVLPGARVLDLFAGTGALGFEAASRGAAEVLLLERDARLAASLRASAERLKVERVAVQCVDALDWLGLPDGRRFDLVFLDPPFADSLWERVAARLAPWLAPKAWVYCEMRLEAGFTLPPGWTEHRSGCTREVIYTLFRVEGGQPEESAVTLPAIPISADPAKA